MSYTPRIMTETGDMDAIRFAAQRLPTQLSDTQILSPALLPSVESNLIEALPGYASLSENHTHLLRSATTNLVAARVVAGLMEKERGMEYSYDRKRKELVDGLISQAQADLAEIMGDNIWPTSLFVCYGPTKRRIALGEWVSEATVLS